MEFRPSPHHKKRPAGKGGEISAVVIHFTSGGTLDGAASWFANPASKVSAHYVIGRSGQVIQMVEESRMAYHAGASRLGDRKRVNDFSIGIELVNWGVLERAEGTYFAWPGGYTRPYSVEQWGAPRLAAGQWWAPYPEAQMVACVELVRALRQRYAAVVETRIVGHSDISPGRKVDPGPLFPMARLRVESRPPPSVLPDIAYLETAEEFDGASLAEMLEHQKDRQGPGEDLSAAEKADLEPVRLEAAEGPVRYCVLPSEFNDGSFGTPDEIQESAEEVPFSHMREVLRWPDGDADPPPEFPSREFVEKAVAAFRQDLPGSGEPGALVLRADGALSEVHPAFQGVVPLGVLAAFRRAEAEN